MEDDKITFSYSLAHELSAWEQNLKYQEALQKVEHELSTLDLNRGGTQAKLSGFVFENLDTSNMNRQYMRNHTGELLEVMDNNGIADMRHTDSLGNVTYQQAKRGYHGNTNKIKKEKYTDQVLVADKGNQELLDHGTKIGLTVRESEISAKASDTMTGIMKAEGTVRQKLGISNTAPVTAKLYALSEQLQNANVVGLNAAKGAAALTAGINFGKNMYAFIEGNIDLRELLVHTAKETAISAGRAYAVGSTGYLASGLLVNPVFDVMVSTQIGTTIVSLGPIFASMSAAAGPVFLIGMAIGTGSAVIQSIKIHSDKYKNKMSKINEALNCALSSMKAAYDDLDQTIKETYDFWDQSFEDGFNKMLSATLNDDFTEFSLGLDTVLNVFDSHVLFRNMDEFDDFFFDENAVLNL